MSVLQSSLESTSLARNPQILSAIEVLKITGKLNVAPIISVSQQSQSSQQSDMMVLEEDLKYSQMQSEARRESVASVSSVMVPRVSPSEPPSSAILSTTSRLRRLGLGPPKRAALGPSSLSSQSPRNDDSTVPKQQSIEDILIPTPPRQTMRHQFNNNSLEPSPLSTFSKSRLNYTGSPLTSALGNDDVEDEDDSDQNAQKENERPVIKVAKKEEVAPAKTRAVKINGKTYRVLHLIGKGGSSKVFKVLAPDNQVMALKKVSLKNLDEATLNGYVNEIELLKKLGNAENIIRLIDAEFNKEHSNLYILMEYGEVDLCQLLRERTEKERDYNFIRYCWQQMLRAVQVVHAAKVVHCDLKPANFLMVKGHLKLIDFGISKAIMNDTTNIVRENQVGTVNYMSPEALQESSSALQKGIIKIGRPSDVWSLGCILYEMTYGKPPFSSFSLIHRLQKIMDTNYRIEFPTIDNAVLLQAIKGCLNRSIKDRFTLDQLLKHRFLMPHLYTEPSLSDPQIDELILRLRQTSDPNLQKRIATSLLRHS